MPTIDALRQEWEKTGKKDSFERYVLGRVEAKSPIDLSINNQQLKQGANITKQAQEREKMITNKIEDPA